MNTNNTNNDMLPEEQDPEFEELITLLRHVDVIDLREHGQIIANARDRLFPTESEVSLFEDSPISRKRVLGSFSSKPKNSIEKHLLGRRLIRQVSTLVALLVIAALVGSALLIFGPWSTLQKDRSVAAHPTGTVRFFTLQVTPSNVAIGGIITLQGTLFSPNGRVVLTRDTSITLVDTHGMNIIHADAQGSFSAAALVDPSWEPGAHSIHAEDASSHKSASFTVFVTGTDISLRPSHLLLTPNALNLGAGDQATNATQVVTLTNTGGGQITWQATVTQPWLLISPTSGTLAFNQKMTVEVAVNRSNLNVGAYTASLVFISNSGQATLPVKMTVTPVVGGMSGS